MSRRNRLSALVVITLSLAGLDARGQTTAFWLNPISGRWVDGANWSTKPVFPADSATGTFTAVLSAAGSPYTVTSDQTVVVSRLNIASADATLAVPSAFFATLNASLSSGQVAVHGGTIAITQAATFSTGVVQVHSGAVLIPGSCIVDGPLHLGISGGEFYSRSFRAQAGSSELSGGTLHFAGTSVLGESGAHRLVQTGGTIHQDTEMLWVGTTGLQPAHGELLIDGPLCRYEYSAIYSRPRLFLGRGLQATAVVNVRNGARPDFPGLVVGSDRGSATLTIDSGSAVVCRQISLGGNNGGHGTLVLAGSTSSLMVLPADGGESLRVGGGLAPGGGTGNFVLNDGTFRARTSVRVLQGGLIEYQRGAFAIDDTLELTGGRMTLTNGRDKVVRAAALSISAEGQLDLADNYAHVDYQQASPIQAIRGLIASAYANGAWTGVGLTSSTAAANPGYALGYAEAASLSSAPAIFGPVDDTSVLIRYTRYGDADLSGRVDLPDFNRLAANFNQNGVWSDGDFNYDGIVNLTDFALLAANFNLSAGPDGVVDPKDWGMLASAAPEPRAICVMMSMLGAVVRRCRRRPVGCART